MNLKRCRDARPDCFAMRDWRCEALADTDFGEKPCPFYKSRDQQEAELDDIRLRRLGRKSEEE